MPNIKNFISINEDFICQNCGHKNSKHQSSCRNHCTNCLYSLHLDKETPGDRLSNCKALMEAISLNQTGKKGFIIIHKCIKCGKIIQNKVAEDDNKDKLIELSLSQRAHE